MKPTQKTCKGCNHLIHNLHFPTGHTRLFCNLAAQNIRDMTNCPRQNIHLTHEADKIRKRKTR